VARELVDDRQEQARVWQLAASLAARSDHPVSRAIAQGLHEGRDAGGGRLRRRRRARHQWPHPRPGAACWATTAGSRRGQQCSPALEARMQAHEALGRSVSLLADDHGVLALFAVADASSPARPPPWRSCARWACSPSC
jgi:Cd2+/Zn2+-exporting ATPase